MDILQQAILDVNKIKEVGMKAAQKKLLEKFSKDLKKLYIKEQENAGLDLEDIGDEETGNEPVDPSGEEGLDLSSLSGGDQNAAEGSAGSEVNAGIEPEEEASFMDNIPGDAGAVKLFAIEMSDDDDEQSDVDEDLDDLGIEGLDLEDIDSIEDLENLTKNLEKQMASGEEQEVNKYGGQYAKRSPDNIKNEIEKGLARRGSKLTAEAESDDESDDSLDSDERDDYFDEKAAFESINKDISINDDVLYEYIQKSLNNEEKFSKLQKTVVKLESMIEDLSEKLNKANVNLKSIKEQNIRLMYKNQALNDDSLSEHQRKNIVAALEKANTITEAKTIYETLKQTTKKVNNSVVNSDKISNSNITKKFIAESKNAAPKEMKKEQLTGIAKKLFDTWGI